MKLQQLDDRLLEQIERLSTAPADEIAGEVQRSEAMYRLAARVIDTGRVRVSVVKLAAEYGHIDRDEVPRLIGAAPKAILAGKGGKR